MNATVHPYVNFGGNARQAMQWYQTIFGGELTLSTFGEMHVPDQPADGIMHAQLLVDGKTVIMASDGMDSSGEHNGFSISVNGTDEEESRTIFEALAEDGDVTVPFTAQVWGDMFGMVTDKFGISWMVDVRK